MSTGTQLALAAVVVGALLPQTPAPAARAASDLQRAVDALMACDDCREGQEQAVLRLGSSAVPVLSAVLRDGPSQADRALTTDRLRTAYQEMKAWEQAHPAANVAITEDEYVKTYLDSYIARHQVRSAAALGRIGGTAAGEALEAALKGPLRQDVQVSVRAALEQSRKR